MNFNRRTITILSLLFLTFTMSGCWETADEGTVKVQTIYGRINRVIKASDGGIWTITTLGDEYHDVNLRAFTEAVPVGASTKDNAALNIQISVTGHVVNNDATITEFVRKFGLEAQDREARLKPILAGQVNTETKNAVAEYDAYNLLANQEQIQKRIFDALKPIFTNQLHVELESVQIIGRPDFLDDRIEQAASAVVANQKAKEAATAALETARVEAERKQVEAQTYANPALLEIRKLELQREVAGAWAAHQGTLVFGQTQGLQIPTGR